MTRFKRATYLLAEWEGQDMILVVCDTLRRFRVDARLVHLLAYLDNWRSIDEICRAGHTVNSDDLSQLVSAGVLEDSSGSPTDRGRVSHYWNPFELAVHRYTNVGGYDQEQIRRRGVLPPPSFKPRRAGKATTLPEPAYDLPFTLSDVLARRRSVRTYDSRPLRLTELSTLLHQSARIVSIERSRLLGDHVFRPFASGGARSELELYVIANNVVDLSPGAHYYDARSHELVMVRSRDAYQERVNRRARMATGDSLNTDPPILVLITAVFSRMMWKYRGMGLSIIYKDVGCLYQTLYMVATALGLGPCGIGGAEESLNSRWLGLDPLVESQVGCVLVGPMSDVSDES